MKKPLRVMTKSNLVSINAHEIEDRIFFALSYEGARFSHFYGHRVEAMVAMGELKDKIDALVTAPAFYEITVPREPDMESKVKYAQILVGKDLNVVVLVSEKYETIEAYSYYPDEIQLSTSMFTGKTIRQAIERCLEEENAFINYEGVYAVAH